MTDSGAPARAGLNRQVGVNLRRVRQARALTVTELARTAGLSRATLTELETGHGNPTVDTLAALSQVLAELVRGLVAGEVHVVVRARQGPVVRRENVRYRLVQKIARAETITELWEAEVSAGEHLAGPMPAGKLAHVYVASGRVRFGPVEHQVALGPADFALYCCDLAHVFAADQRSRLLVCLTYSAASAHQALSLGHD